MQDWMILRVARRERQTDVARQIGIDNTYLSKIENGKTEPTPALVRKLEEHYGIGKTERK